MRQLGALSSGFTFNRVVLTWHGPYPWPKATGAFKLDNAIMDDPGLYRAETNGRGRQLIKYIGSASENFRQRLNKDHRINKEIVNGGRLNVTMYLATMAPERRIRLTRPQLVEIEYILQNVHWSDLISQHGLQRLPKTSRGQGWHIVNKGKKGGLARVIAYPAFAVSGQDRR